MSKQSLLLVDGDARSLRVLEVTLKKAGFNVTTATTGNDALEKLAISTPDLIIAESSLADLDGFELCRRVKSTPAYADIPFVFLTSQTEIEHKIRGLELGGDDYLTKPIYLKEVVTRIRILLQKRQRARIEEGRDGRTRFAGKLADVTVVDLIQTVEVSRKSGLIQFAGETGKTAAIYFRNGKVIDAEAGPLAGEDAVYRLLTWNEGDFDVVFRTVRRRDVIQMSSQALLMEGMRRLDEWGRLLEQMPALDAKFEIDAEELSAKLGDVPDEFNTILRLFDGNRTLYEVIDASEYGDLESLEVIAKLYFEGLLVEVLGDAGPAFETREAAPAAHWLDLTASGRPREVAPPVVASTEVAFDDVAGPTGDEGDSDGVIEAPHPVEAIPLAALAPPVANGPMGSGSGPTSSPTMNPSPIAEALVDSPMSRPIIVPPSAPVAVGVLADAPARPARRRSLIEQAVDAADIVGPEEAALFDSPAFEVSARSRPALPTPSWMSANTASLVDDAEAESFEDPTPLPHPIAFDDPSGPKEVGSMGADAATAFGELRGRVESGPVPHEVDDEPVPAVLIAEELSNPEIRLPGVVPAEVAGTDSRKITRRTTPPPLPHPTAPVVRPRSRRTTPPPLPPRKKSPTTRPPPMPRPLPGVTPAAHDDQRSRPAEPQASRPPPTSGVLWLAILVAAGAVGGAALLWLSPQRPPPAERPEGTYGIAAVPRDAAEAVLVDAGIVAVVIVPAMDAGRILLDAGARPSDAGLRADASVLAPPDAGRLAIPDAAVVIADAGARPILIDAGAKPPPDGAVKPDAGTRLPMDASLAPVPVDAGLRVPVDAPVVPAKNADLVAAQAAIDDNQPEQALTLADKAIASRATPAAHLIRAEALRRLSRFDEAVWAIDDALAIDKAHAPAWEIRGRFLEGMRRTAEAREAYEQYLFLKPTGKTSDKVRKRLEALP